MASDPAGEVPRHPAPAVHLDPIDELATEIAHLKERVAALEAAQQARDPAPGG